MPQEIKTGSAYNTYIPSLTDTADIVTAFTNYHYGINTGTAPGDGAVTDKTGIAGWFKYLDDSKAPEASPTFTGTVVLPATTSIGDVSNIEIGYLDGVTKNIQTELNKVVKQVAPDSLSASATLTLSNLSKRIILFTGTSNATLTLPLPASLSFSSDDDCLDWTIILNNSSPGTVFTVTVAGSTGHTLVGKPIIVNPRITYASVGASYNGTEVNNSIRAATTGSATFRTRRVNSTTYITYRIS